MHLFYSLIEQIERKRGSYFLLNAAFILKFTNWDLRPISAIHNLYVFVILFNICLLVLLSQLGMTTAIAYKSVKFHFIFAK